MLNTIPEELNKSLEEAEEEKERIKQEKLEPKPKTELFPKEEPKERKERKPKKLAPEYVFIFDDLGNDLRLPSITQLEKEADTTNASSSLVLKIFTTFPIHALRI